jgi:outer membrane murein-binding lipoprotein Lpp
VTEPQRIDTKHFQAHCVNINHAKRGAFVDINHTKQFHLSNLQTYIFLKVSMDSLLKTAKDLASKVNPELAAQIEQAKHDFGAAYADAARSLGETAKGEIGSMVQCARRWRLGTSLRTVLLAVK